MTTSTVEIYGRRIRQARLARRSTAKDVLAKMGWKGPRLTRMERETVVELDTSELEKLSEILRFPVEFFTSAPMSRVETEDLSFRAPKSQTLTERNRIAEMMALAGDFLCQLDAVHKLPPVTIGTCPSLDPVAAAAEARRQLGLGSDETVGDLTYLLECHGVPVLMRSERFGSEGLEDNQSGRLEKHLGCSAWVGEYNERPLIMVRELDSWERTRWTLAHELGHVLLHAGIKDITEEHESEANRFASEFLAPYKFASRGVPANMSLVSLLSVKSHWGISIGALLRHFHDSGGLNDELFTKLQKQLYTRRNVDTGHTWGRTEPGWDDRLPERPRLLSKWMEVVYGTSSAKQVAGTSKLMWPRDIMSEFSIGQRGATYPAAQRTSTVGSRAPETENVVVEFSSYRRRGERQA